MADGNGSNADKADNASLDAMDRSNSSGGSDVISGEVGQETIGNPNAKPSNSLMNSPEVGGVSTKPSSIGNSLMDELNPEVGGKAAKQYEENKPVIDKLVQEYRSGIDRATWEAMRDAAIKGAAGMDPEDKIGSMVRSSINAMNEIDKALDRYAHDQAYPNGEFPAGYPVVLDLDGDGLDLVSINESKALYDIDGDGYLENVGWVGDGDGFLSVDLNGDGLILDPKELAFALSTDDPNDTDLEGLAATYDTNKDGVLDAQDADFAKFKVWRDIDQDGVCDAGEVKSLAEHGITSINLTSDKKEEVIAGNKVYGSTTYTKTDGTTGKVGDVGLATSAAGWKKEEVTGGIKFNYEGTGDNAGRALFEAAAATALIMDVAAAGLAGAMGAELNDSLSTSGDKDVLLGGGAGNDTLTGGAGNDWLAGGEGMDSLNGGAGHDILFVDSQDKIQGGEGFDVAIVTDDKAVNYDLAKIGIEAVSAGMGDDVLNAANRNAQKVIFAFAA